MDSYSTREAAQLLGISWPTLNKYIALKQIPIPPLTRVGGVRVRLWSSKDIENVREFLPRIANGRKTRWKKHAAEKKQLAKPKVKTSKKSNPRSQSAG